MKTLHPDCDNDMATVLLGSFDRSVRSFLLSLTYLFLQGTYPIINKQIWKKDISRGFDKIPGIICKHLSQTGALFADHVDPFLNWITTLSGYDITL